MTASILLTAPIASVHADAIDDKAAICAACHGEKGIPIDKSIPVIWGQNEGYIYLELRDFKRGNRKSAQMAPIVADLSRDDMLALASYFSQKKWPSLAQPSAAKSVATAAITVIGSVGCTSCHLEQFQGDSATPRLADQNRDYLLKTMTEFRSGARANNPGMTALLTGVSDTDLAALADYLSGF
ncbi:MAG: c-type cytochrome [Methylocella sp.]